MGKMKKPKKQATATPIPPPPIPVQDTAVTDDVKKKAEAKRAQRGGIASTVLTDTLGG